MLRAALGTVSVSLFLLLPSGRAEATFTLEQVRCRGTIARSAAKLAHRAAVHTAKCHRSRDRRAPKSGHPADCNRLDYASGDRAYRAEAGLRSRVAGDRSRCRDDGGDDLDPYWMGYRACPDPCAAPIGDLDELADCLVCLVKDSVERMSEASLGGPPVGICHSGSRDGLACSSCVGGERDGRPCDSDQECAGGGNCTTASDHGDTCTADDDCGLGGECRDGRCLSPCDGGSVCKYSFCSGGPSNGQPCSLGVCAGDGVCEDVMGNDLRRCRLLAGKKQAQHFATLLKERVKCQSAEERAGGMSTAWCATANPRGRIGKVRARGEKALHKRCGPQASEAACEGPVEAVPAGQPCTEVEDVCQLRACVFDGSEASGADLFENFYALANAAVTTTTTSTTTGGESEDSTTTTTTTTTLPPSATWTEVRAVFSDKCASCHVGGAALGGLGGLDDAAAGYAALVGVSSLACPGNTLVVAGDPGASYLLEKLEEDGPACGSRMPMGTPLTPEELETVRSWISGGALDD